MVKIFFETKKEKKYSLNFFFILLLIVTVSACKSGPENLEYGKDSCAFCKMQLMDTKYGAELITEKGKVYNLMVKNDSSYVVNCFKQKWMDK